MKFLHLSDLHIGKRVNEYSMIEDQKFILKRILNIIDEEKPDCVLIAGDVYDKSVPSAEAVELFDSFLTSLAKRRLEVFIISGNHDSPERLSFGRQIMAAGGIHISPAFCGAVEPQLLTDEFGEVCVYMLPFVKPGKVREFFPEESIETYTDAISVAAESMRLDKTKRNVLITHQFVTGASTSESEDVSVGGADNVDASVFEDFDYVALGHLHRPQSCGSEKIRYCGTPLKYSFSEVNDEKSVTVVELGKKGELSVRVVGLEPLRDMHVIRGKYADVMLKEFYGNTSLQEDYVHIVLTDEEDIFDAVGKLRTVYHNLMKVSYDNKRTRTSQVISADAEVSRKSPLELFSEFFELQNNQPLDEEMTKFVKDIIEDVWEVEI